MNERLPLTDAEIDAICAPGRAQRWHGDGRQYDRDTARLIEAALATPQAAAPAGTLTGRALIERVIERLQMDIDDGGRPDQWSMEGMQRDLRAALASPAPAPSVEPAAYFFRFHTDDSLEGKPNVRSWMLAEGVPPASLYESGEVRPLFDAAPSAPAREQAEPLAEPDFSYSDEVWLSAMEAFDRIKTRGFTEWQDKMRAAMRVLRDGFAAPQAEPVLPADLVCDGMTFRKGVKLSTVALRMNRLREEAFGPLPSKEEAEANLAALQGRAPSEQGAPAPATRATESGALREALERIAEYPRASDEGLTDFGISTNRSYERSAMVQIAREALAARPPESIPAPAIEQREALARDGADGSLETMAKLVIEVRAAEKNGAALGLVARFRYDERLDAVNAALATPQPTGGKT